LLSSHAFSIGRISSRTRSAMVGPPLNTCVLRSEVKARTRLVTEPAAALAVSIEAMPGADIEALMGEVSDWGGVAAVCGMGVGSSGSGGEVAGGEGGNGRGGGVTKAVSLDSEAGRLMSGTCGRGTGIRTGETGNGT
jgi:hypothetical protein